MALLEKLRTDATLDLKDHRKGHGLKRHEKWGKAARKRYGIPESPNKNDGRRSNQIDVWGPSLLLALDAAGFCSASSTAREALLTAAQTPIADSLREVLATAPISVRIRGRTAEFIIGEVLQKAEERRKSGDVAQYLVAAKLMLRLKIEIPVVAANRGDRKSFKDTKARLGDLPIGNSVIEIALGLPDDKHLEQIADVVGRDKEMWLLTRADRVATWRNEAEKRLEPGQAKKVVFASVESFIGQNITELAWSHSTGLAEELEALFALYNDRWIETVKTPGIRIHILK